MANPEHLEILRQGVEQWNKWREGHPEVLHLDLSGAKLRGADLRVANLIGADFGSTIPSEADLRRANLKDADLRRADLTLSNLAGANLSEANLTAANLSGAILTGAYIRRGYLRQSDLSNTDLSGTDLGATNLFAANLRWARLDGADFTTAEAWATVFADVDLSVAKGLDTVVHRGPSTIGIDTIYKSRGKIPMAFLRGCGVPDNFIEYMHSLTGQAFEFYSCFISYSTKDQAFAERLHADLQAMGVRCWFAPHDIQGGRKLHEQIDEAIRLYDKLLLILSADSMTSEWVQTEIAKARKREAQEKRQMLFPVALVPYDPVIKNWECFDADRGKDSAREIREYFIPDFSNWKDHDSYQTAFQRLVKDLKSDAAKGH